MVGKALNILAVLVDDRRVCFTKTCTIPAAMNWGLSGGHLALRWPTVKPAGDMAAFLVSSKWKWSRPVAAN
jgi:hypothetical protein